MNKLYLFSLVLVATVHGLLFLGNSSPQIISKSYQVAIKALNSKSILPVEERQASSSKFRTSKESYERRSKAQSHQNSQKGLASQYLKEVTELVESHKRYPFISMQLGEQGVVGVIFTLRSSGELKTVFLKDRSKYQRLNDAALSTIKSIKRFPKFPAKIKEEELELALSLQYLK